VQEARQIVGSDTPLYLSEWNDGLYGNPAYHDTPYAAAFIIKNVYDVNGLADIFSWWTFSDIFEEQGDSPGQLEAQKNLCSPPPPPDGYTGFFSDPFFADTQWGLLDIYGIPAPSYRYFAVSASALI
jgi:hypothetical protein